MKKKNKEILLQLEDNGERQEYTIDENALREALKNLKVDKEATVLLKLQTSEGEEKELQIKVSELRTIVKMSELMDPIVPRLISEYLIDMTYVFSRKRKAKLVGRDNEIEKIWFYLSQKKRNNVFLVGDADVGKTSICREIIRQIATSECPKEFYEHRVLMLRPAQIVKVEDNKIKFRLILKVIMEFIVNKKDNIILYIEDSFDMLTHETLWKMLETIITKYNIPVITTSLPKNMEEYFLEIDSISKYVNLINIEEPELDEIYPMIRNFIKKKEKEYGIKAPDDIVQFGIFSSPLAESISANPGNVINIFEKAFLEAKRKEKEELDKASILSCYDTDLKHYNEMPETEKRATAYHEIGHYLATVRSERLKDRKVAFVTILPMVWFLGLTETYLKNTEEVNHSKEYYLDYIAMLMAGRVAESRIKEQNMGAYSDLKSANDVAKAMIMKFGLSESSHNHNRYYDYEDYYLLSEEKKAQIDEEIQQITDEGYKRAEELISEAEKDGLLEALAEQLLKDEILSGQQLKEICDEYRKKE